MQNDPYSTISKARPLETITERSQLQKKKQWLVKQNETSVIRYEQNSLRWKPAINSQHLQKENTQIDEEPILITHQKAEWIEQLTL